jgi:hypothetical protein
MENIFSRIHLTRFFLWISVISWGILLGAKLFDLRVLVGAWSASIPESLNLLPYGVRYPVDTGQFFIPISAALLISSLGALISGWKTRLNYRVLLIISTVMIFATLVFTVVAFWPRNAALWAVAQGSPNAIKDITAIRLMVSEWITFDWLRIALGSIGFVSAVRAISIPFPIVIEIENTSFGMKVLYGICISVVILFVIYFLSQM